MTTYKVVSRNYYDSFGSLTLKKGRFIARGQWADGHLAYSRLDDEGNEIEGEECMYFQLRGSHGLYMQRI